MTKNPITEQRLVLRVPGTDDVVVDRDVPFGGGASGNLRMDIYRPSAEETAPLPVLVFVTGYSDAGGRKLLGCALKDMASYMDWARLVASFGIAAITYENEEPVRDVHLLLRHIEQNAGPLNIDTARIGLWACSGNVPNALALLQHDEPFKCAALCYGYMLDTAGSDDVARAAAQWGFVNPAAAMAPDRLARTPMLIVRAGRDDTPDLNASIDRFVARAVQENLAVTLVNHPDGPHAFDILDDSAESRTAIRQVVAFLGANLLE